MFKQIYTFGQRLLPHHLISALAGYLADSTRPAVKNYLIKNFTKTYQINMAEAIQEDPLSYPSFNDFFIRRLKPALRPIADGNQTVISPVDGTIAQIGNIHKRELLQTKDMYFDLDTLLTEPALATQFENGSFATFYLAPYNYHRIHMPIDGQLTKTIFVPGRLFSVNRMTTELLPQLYSRNERLICLFDTQAGPMAVIMVGAMIVGSIVTPWAKQQPIREQLKMRTFPNGPTFNKGDEIGYFKLGSTVITLFTKDTMHWQEVSVDSTVQYGQKIGNII